MKRGFKVLDSDIHVMEPGDLYLRYMDPKWGDRVPRASGARPPTGIHTFTRADGSRVRALPPEGRGRADPVAGAPAATIDQRFADAREADYDAASMLKGMDIEGVDVAVLFRTQPLYADESQEAEYAFAIAGAWNDWVTDYASANPARLKPAGQVPLHDVRMATEEARRVARKGHIGLCVHPEPMNGRLIHDPYFDPLWAAAQELNLPICIHPTAGGNVGAVGNRYMGLNPTYLWGAMTQPIEDLLAVVSFCGGGILDRFPRLRVAFLEGNCSWLPWLLWRLDERYEATASRSFAGLKGDPPMKVKPGELFRRQGFVSIDADEFLGADTVRRLGDDNLVFSTDWPHGDAKYPQAVDTLLSLEGIGEASKRKVLWDNTARLYGL